MQALNAPVIGASWHETYTRGRGARAHQVERTASFQLRAWELVLGGLAAWVFLGFPGAGNLGLPSAGPLNTPEAVKQIQSNLTDQYGVPITVIPNPLGLPIILPFIDPFPALSGQRPITPGSR